MKGGVNCWNFSMTRIWLKINDGKKRILITITNKKLWSG